MAALSISVKNTGLKKPVEAHLGKRLDSFMKSPETWKYIAALGAIHTNRGICEDSRDFNGSPITFRADGWFNMTKAAAHFGKNLKEFWSNTGTSEYIHALGSVLLNGGNSPQLESTKGRYVDTSRGRYGGTWAHPKLAVFFARWLDVRFSVWCDAVIEDILKGAAEVTITKPQESAVMAVPQAYAELLQQRLP
jgi:hypothetical protein